MTRARTPSHTEQDSLLPGSDTSSRRRSSSGATMSRWKPSWDAHPFWLIPVVLVMSMSRGLTMSPRIEVYKTIACRALSEPGLGDDLRSFSFVECGKADMEGRAAKIQASVVTTMSVLSAISTGFWSRLGDAHGRKLILSTFLIGALLMEGVFVLVMRPDSLFGRHAEQFILLGPIIEGFVGGLSTFNGVVHAYISDCTRHGSRSTIFSTVQGMVFVGLASGPWIGGIFFPPVGYRDGYFFGSIGLITATLIYVNFICPESLKPSMRQTARLRNPDHLSFKESPLLSLQRLSTNFVSALLLPVSMFRPRRIPGTSRRNWNMTLCGLSLFGYIVSTGVYSAKYLYAKNVYHWNVAQLGYYMSTLWITRAFNLLVFLPIILSYVKPPSTTAPGSQPNVRDISAELHFDQRLAQISLAVDGFADTLVAAISHNSQPLFYLFSCLSSFTSGGNPALHSLGAVCLHACGYGSEVGALFGAMGVLSAIGHIVSPYFYALTYSRSVANFPEAIFVLAAALLFTVVFFLSRVSSAEDDISFAPSPVIGANEEDTRRISREYAYHSLSNSTEDDPSPEGPSRRL